MKELFFLFAIFFALTIHSNAQVSADDTAPVITFEKTTHDYGTIKKGADGTYEFVFKNTGKEPLILSKPRSNCGCTVPDWPQEPIMPGQSNKIKVTYNTNLIGVFNKQVTIISNASNSPVVLQIKGTVQE